MTSLPSLHNEPVTQALTHFLKRVPKTRRVLVGYSGGVDSHVLLHSLKQHLDTRPDLDLLAVHINHGMQSQSGDWVNHCKNQCRALEVALTCIDVDVSPYQAQGPEASARMARYGAFATVMREGDYLLLAQHADDQVETFLLQALRGSGPDGLASIPQQRTFAMGHLCRPLLGCYRSQIEHYAAQAALHWIEDPSNDDTMLDRNYLRNSVIPLLKDRWPSLNQTISRAASRCGAASSLLKSMAQDDLDFSRYDPAEQDQLLHGSIAVLNATRLASLGEERVFNTLRLWVRENGLALPGLEHLKQVANTLLQNSDAISGRGVVHIDGYGFRRYQQVLHLCRLEDQVPDDIDTVWEPPFAPLHLRAIGITLDLAACQSMGLVFDQSTPVDITTRRGSEVIQLRGRGHKAIKKLFQEAGVPPWRRQRYPLMYQRDRVIAIWGLQVADTDG